MSLDDVVDELVLQYNTRLDKNRPLIAAINGLSGAGKTTLVKEMEQELSKTHNISVIHIDDHIVEKDNRYNTGYEEWVEYYVLQWDAEKIVDELFAKIHNYSMEIMLPFYDKSTDMTMTKKVAIEANSIILIEGIFLQREEWHSFYDYVVFIDCPEVVRYKRVLNRDLYIGDSDAIINKYKTRYWPAEDYYIKKVQPIKKADLVVHSNR